MLYYIYTKKLIFVVKNRSYRMNFDAKPKNGILLTVL